jgi:hypothetical protein
MKRTSMSGSTRRLLARIESGQPPRQRRIRREVPAIEMLQTIRRKAGAR